MQHNTAVTLDGLLEFLDFAGRNGLIKKSAAQSRKSACGAILGILDDTDKKDLSKLDLKNVFDRYRNLSANKVPPPTLRTYESKCRTALGDFIEYTKNPAAWKPSSKSRTRTTKSSGEKPEPKDSTIREQESISSKDSPNQPSVHIDLQIHISPDATAEQIDQVFASMRRHLYGNRTNE